MPDYNILQAKVKNKLAVNGREVTFVKKSRVAAVANEPWKSRTTTTTQVKTYVVETEFNSKEASSDNVEYGDKKLLVNAVDISNAQDYDTVKDGNDSWRIKGVSALKPGAVVIMYEVHIGK